MKPYNKYYTGSHISEAKFRHILREYIQKRVRENAHRFEEIKKQAKDASLR